jgi:hypothetical protein
MIRPYSDDSSGPIPRWYPQSDKRTPRIRRNIPAPMKPQEQSCPLPSASDGRFVPLRRAGVLARLPQASLPVVLRRLLKEEGSCGDARPTKIARLSRRRV